MKILDFGSINIDRVYGVDHFVRPGETISALDYARFPGGKGFNQSTALARAGATVCHAGCIGEDGLWLRDELEHDGVDVHLIRVADAPTGHAVIQVDASGQNCIVICGGANRLLDAADVRAALAGFGRDDVILLQNETTMVGEAISAAAAKGLEVVFNPAPMDPAVLELPLDKVSLFIVNEVEAEGLCGCRDDDPHAVLDALAGKFPGAGFVVTLGERGAAARIPGAAEVFVPARRTPVVDTTAAGDTFTGYFLAERQRGASVKTAMEIATAAAAVCVSRKGAATSIPGRAELVIA